MEEKKKKRSIFETPLLSTKIKSADAKIFPEGALGYFLGPTLALLANSVLSTYLNQYMTDVLDMMSWADWFVTWLPVVSVVFVIIGNILVGRLMDRSRTKAGKARPLLLLAIPLGILALLVLFVISPTPNEQNNVIIMILFAIGYNLWYAIAYPFYYTSHAALVNLSTRNSKMRSLLATFSNATNLAAVGLCTMILPFFVGILFVSNNGVIDQAASMNAWRIFAIALVVVNFLGIVLEYFFTRERITEESFKLNVQHAEKKPSATIGQQAKICFKDKFWIIMIVFFFLYQLGGMMKNVSQFYYCQAWFPQGGVYSKDAGGSFSGQLAIYGAIPTALGMVIAWPLSNKIGKGRAILFGAILSAVGGAIGFIAPDNFICVTAAFVIKALGSTPAMYLSLALLADILDHQEAQHKVRTDGLTMTIYGAIMAGMTGIATGILNIALQTNGYNAAMITNPTPELQNALLWIFIGGETLCYAAIAIIFIFMGVEKFSKLDHKAIVLDQKAEAEAKGEAYIDPATKLKLEEEQAEADSEKARIEELRARCEKKGLNFEEEEKKFEEARATKAEAAAQKKAEADAKKAEKERLAKEEYDALPEEQKQAIEAKKAEKARKKAEADAKTLVEFNKLRVACGRPELVPAGEGEYALAPATAETAE